MDGAVAAYPYDGIAMTALFQIEVEIIEDSGSRQADSLVGSLGGRVTFTFERSAPAADVNSMTASIG